MSSNGDDKIQSASDVVIVDEPQAKNFNVVSNNQWVQQWEKKKIGFHQSDVHGLLEKYFDKLLNGREQMTVFVPLCGKSVDMKWLYDKGMTVIGVELVEQAVIDFFDEQGLEYIKEDIDDIKGSLYKTKDGKLRIYQCDIFDYKKDMEEEIGGIWDRAAFVAINREDRTKFGDLMKSMMSSDTTYLLVTLDFDETIHAGPPQFVAEEVIEDLYSKDYNLKLLEYRDALEDRHRAWGLSSFNERLHLITKN